MLKLENLELVPQDLRNYCKCGPLLVLEPNCIQHPIIQDTAKLCGNKHKKAVRRRNLKAEQRLTLNHLPDYTPQKMPIPCIKKQNNASVIGQNLDDFPKEEHKRISPEFLEILQRSNSFGDSTKTQQVRDEKTWLRDQESAKALTERRSCGDTKATKVWNPNTTTINSDNRNTTASKPQKSFAWNPQLDRYMCIENFNRNLDEADILNPSKTIYLLNILIKGGQLQLLQLVYLMGFLRATVNHGERNFDELLRLLKAFNLLDSKVIKYLRKIFLRMAGLLSPAPLSMVLRKLDKLESDIYPSKLSKRIIIKDNYGDQNLEPTRDKPHISFAEMPKENKKNILLPTQKTFIDIFNDGKGYDSHENPQLQIKPLIRTSSKLEFDGQATREYQVTNKTETFEGTAELYANKDQKSLLLRNDHVVADIDAQKGIKLTEEIPVKTTPGIGKETASTNLLLDRKITPRLVDKNLPYKPQISDTTIKPLRDPADELALRNVNSAITQRNGRVAANQIDIDYQKYFKLQKPITNKPLTWELRRDKQPISKHIPLEQRVHQRLVDRNLPENLDVIKKGSNKSRKPLVGAFIEPDRFNGVRESRRTNIRQRDPIKVHQAHRDLESRRANIRQRDPIKVHQAHRDLESRRANIRQRDPIKVHQAHPDLQQSGKVMKATKNQRFKEKDRIAKESGRKKHKLDKRFESSVVDKKLHLKRHVKEPTKKYLRRIADDFDAVTAQSTDIQRKYREADQTNLDSHQRLKEKDKIAKESGRRKLQLTKQIESGTVDKNLKQMSHIEETTKKPLKRHTDILDAVKTKGPNVQRKVREADQTGLDLQKSTGLIEETENEPLEEKTGIGKEATAKNMQTDTHIGPQEVVKNLLQEVDKTTNVPRKDHVEANQMDVDSQKHTELIKVTKQQALKETADKQLHSDTYTEPAVADENLPQDTDIKQDTNKSQKELASDLEENKEKDTNFQQKDQVDLDPERNIDTLKETKTKSDKVSKNKNASLDKGSQSKEPGVANQSTKKTLKELLNSLIEPEPDRFLKDKIKILNHASKEDLALQKLVKHRKIKKSYPHNLDRVEPKIKKSLKKNVAISKETFARPLDGYLSQGKATRIQRRLKSNVNRYPEANKVKTNIFKGQGEKPYKKHTTIIEPQKAPNKNKRLQIADKFGKAVTLNVKRFSTKSPLKRGRKSLRLHAKERKSTVLITNMQSHSTISEDSLKSEKLSVYHSGKKAKGTTKTLGGETYKAFLHGKPSYDKVSEATRNANNSKAKAIATEMALLEEKSSYDKVIEATENAYNKHAESTKIADNEKAEATETAKLPPRPNIGLNMETPPPPLAPSQFKLPLPSSQFPLPNVIQDKNKKKRKTKKQKSQKETLLSVAKQIPDDDGEPKALEIEEGPEEMDSEKGSIEYFKDYTDSFIRNELPKRPDPTEDLIEFIERAFKKRFIPKEGYHKPVNIDLNWSDIDLTPKRSVRARKSHVSLQTKVLRPKIFSTIAEVAGEIEENDEDEYAILKESAQFLNTPWKAESKFPLIKTFPHLYDERKTAFTPDDKLHYVYTSIDIPYMKRLALLHQKLLTKN